METVRLIDKGHSPKQAAKIAAERLGHNRMEILSAYIAWTNGKAAGA